MLNPSLLRSLPEIPVPVLTVYLNTDRADSDNRKLTPGYMSWLRSHASALAETVTPEEKRLYLEQLARVEEYLSAHRPCERAIAIFAGPTTWELVSLPLKLSNEISWGRPALPQLLWLMDEHQACGIVVVIRKGARFYLYWLGELVELEQKEFVSNVLEWKKKDLGKFEGTGTAALPGIHKSRGSQHDVFEHRMDAQYRHFCREVAEGIQLHWPDKSNQRAVFLVGLEEMVQGVLEELPETIRERVVPVKEDLGWGWVSRSDLQSRLEPIIQEWERQREITLVDALLSSERGAVLGIDETLVRLQQGAARSLIVENDLEADLHRCEACGWLDRVAGPPCTVCGGKRHAASLREALPELVRRFGTAIEIVGGDAARKLHEAGGMGAWLRQIKTLGVPQETERNAALRGTNAE